MPLGIGIWEILVLLGVLLLVFGPRKLPELGRSLGSGVRELRDSLTGTGSPEEAKDTDSFPSELEGTR